MRLIKIISIQSFNTEKYEYQLNAIEEGINLSGSIILNGWVDTKFKDCKIQSLKFYSKGQFTHNFIGTNTNISNKGFFSKFRSKIDSEKFTYDIILHPKIFYKDDYIRVNVVFNDNSEESICEITIELDSDFKDVYQEKLIPIKLLTLGRTGSTYVMNLLSEHPGVVVNDHFNESNISSYYLNFIDNLYSPIQSSDYGEGLSNLKNIEAIQNRSFIEFPFITNSEWYSDIYPKNLISFAKKNIDDYYLFLSDKNTKYFIEKAVIHDTTLTLLDKVYANKKYIFLVRDFRDMYSSILAFNKKRGSRAFGMENYEKDEDYIKQLGFYTNECFLPAYEKVKNQAFLLKYEELIKKPKKTLKNLYKFLDLDYSDITIDKILDSLAKTRKILQEKHMTSSDANNTMKRYKKNLDNNTIILIETAFDKSLKYFGYKN